MHTILLSAVLTAGTIAAAPGEQAMSEYFRAQVLEIEEQSLTVPASIEEWEKIAARARTQLAEMLSLAPMPERTELNATVTGQIEREGIVVEKLHYQSLPGLYVTGNLYRPATVSAPLPAILYLCGHALVKTNGISYGNKSGYQHHGVWFAKNGYVCLVIDTIQLGEIEGVHHGTHREGMWWWNARGYTPAGVEAWNGIRALDYLETRPDVDRQRIGVTGRSGGGAYSWWVAALDERVKVAAPVAGITDLRNHVVDGVVEGHCDCMFMVNTHRWDYPMVAALAAPRPLMIANTDRDPIFPLDGVERVHAKVARIYELYRKPGNLALLITPGPHKDTQDLQIPVFRWMNQHLKGEDPLIESAAKKIFTADELKVFRELPHAERTSAIHHSFVATNRVELPGAPDDWVRMRAAWMNALRTQVFGGWPQVTSPLDIQRSGNAEDFQVSFLSQEGIRLTLLVRQPNGGNAKKSILRVYHDPASPEPDEPGESIIATLIVRGFGPANPKGEPKAAVQMRRRYMLLGQTLDGMRVWDIARAIEVLRSLPETASLPLEIQAEGHPAVNALYASLFNPVDRLTLQSLPNSHSEGPDYLNILRFMDIPQALALALERCDVAVEGNLSAAEYADKLAARLNWPRRTQRR